MAVADSSADFPPSSSSLKWPLAVGFVSSLGLYLSRLEVTPIAHPNQSLGAVPYDLNCVLQEIAHDLTSSGNALMVLAQLVRRLFTLSYGTTYKDRQGQMLFEKGPLDALFVLGCVFLFVVIQRGCERLLMPLALKLVKRAEQERQRTKKVKTLSSSSSSTSTSTGEEAFVFNTKAVNDAKRMVEQCFFFVWYSLSFLSGYWIYTNEPYYPILQNSPNLWTDFPLTRLSFTVKCYYLVQAAFWLQQLAHFLFFIPPAERRKDHWAMTAHHVITTVLILSSYVVHFTRVGNAVLVTMDLADLVLSLAKCLKYLGPGYQLVCDSTFAVFALVWLVTRHGLYFRLVWSVGAEIPPSVFSQDAYWGRLMQTEEDWLRPGRFFTPNTQKGFLVCFACLQMLLIYWFAMIMKVIMKVVRGSGADDVREDEEED